MMSLTKGRMMKIRSQVFTGVFVALLLVVVYSSVAQIKGGMTTADIFGSQARAVGGIGRNCQARLFCSEQTSNC